MGSKGIIISYNGLDLNKSQWAKHLGISRKSFEERYKRYYPDHSEKVFSEFYLNSSISETMKEHQIKVKQSVTLQEERYKIYERIKRIKNQISILQAELHEAQEELEELK